MLDVYWFSGLMLCICSLCYFVRDSSKIFDISRKPIGQKKKKNAILCISCAIALLCTTNGPNINYYLRIFYYIKIRNLRIYHCNFLYNQFFHKH